MYLHIHIIPSQGRIVHLLRPLVTMRHTFFESILGCPYRITNVCQTTPFWRQASIRVLPTKVNYTLLQNLFPLFTRAQHQCRGLAIPYSVLTRGVHRLSRDREILKGISPLPRCTTRRKRTVQILRSDVGSAGKNSLVLMLEIGMSSRTRAGSGSTLRAEHFSETSCEQQYKM